MRRYPLFFSSSRCAALSTSSPTALPAMSRPISRTKRWVVQEILKRSEGGAEINLEPAVEAADMTEEAGNDPARIAA